MGSHHTWNRCTSPTPCKTTSFRSDDKRTPQEKSGKAVTFLASLTISESHLNASAWLGLSALYQGGTSCLLELGGLPGVTFGMILPRGILSTGSSEGCHLWGLGDCLGTGAGGAAEVGCSSTGEVLCSRVSGGSRGV